VLKNGVICPLDPLPPEWTDGRELQVEDAQETDDSPEAIDERFDELEASAAQVDDEDWKRMQAALDKMHHEAKEWVRREMGLP
jgi:hypothetical protein